MAQPKNPAKLADGNWRIAFLAATLVLSACGGGGAASPAPSPAPAPAPTPAPAPAPTPAPAGFNLNAALASIYTNGVTTRTVSARAADTSLVTQKITITPAPDAMFAGVLRKAVTKTVETIVTASNGNQQILNDVRTVYFTVSPTFQIIGSIAGTGAYTEFVARAGLSSNAALGDTGELSSSVTYVDSSKATISSTSSVTWAMEADTSTGTSSYVCIISDATERPNGTKIKGGECYQIDRSGNLMSLRTLVTFFNADNTTSLLDLR